MPISRHFQDCKALLVTSPIHVSGAIAIVQTFTFAFIDEWTKVRWRATVEDLVRKYGHFELHAAECAANVG